VRDRISDLLTPAHVWADGRVVVKAVGGAVCLLGGLFALDAVLGTRAIHRTKHLMTTFGAQVMEDKRKTADGNIV
jgi:hypothetical protein